MDYQKLIVAGNVTGDVEKKVSKNGDVSYTTFDVGVSDARDQSTFFAVVVFGKHGETVARYVTKGQLVLVEGRVDVSDKGRFSVIADNVRFGPEPATAKVAE